MTTFVSEGEVKLKLTGWQHASQSEQNARAPHPQLTCVNKISQSYVQEVEREHVARSSRHFAGLPVRAQICENST
jgi:hypothetical protein